MRKWFHVSALNALRAGSSGAAYVFVRSGTAWSQQAYLKASNTETFDSFGTSVAVSGDTVVVGAIGEAGSSTSVNGNQRDNTAVGAGAGYVFTGVGLGIFPDRSGGYSVRFKDRSGLTYRLQRAPSVTGPWDTIGTLTATEPGIIGFHDANPPPGQAFYRTAQP